MRQILDILGGRRAGKTTAVKQRHAAALIDLIELVAKAGGEKTAIYVTAGGEPVLVEIRRAPKGRLTAMPVDETLRG